MGYFGRKWGIWGESGEFSLYLSRFLIVHFHETSGAFREMFLIIMQLAADKMQILLQNSVFIAKSMTAIMMPCIHLDLQ